MHQKRTYRNQIYQEGLRSYRVVVKETDLFITSDKDLRNMARELILLYRGQIEAFIDGHPFFADSLTPVNIPSPVPGIVSDMIAAADKAGVGPMASVAGAIAERIGTDLCKDANHVIVENGGDVFIRTKAPVTVGIFADRSPLNMAIGLQIDAADRPVSVCTSSGTVGHSLSFGTADAVSVVSHSCALADAAATAIGNRVAVKQDIEKAIEFGNNIKGVNGIVIIKDDVVGMWGDLTVVQLKEKNG